MFLRKITIDRIAKRPDQITDRQFAARVIGEVRNARQEESQFGPFTRFYGRFAAQSSLGEFESGVLIMPKVVEEWLLARFGDGQAPVLFALDVFFSPATRAGGAAYEYVFEVVYEEKKDDDFSKLVGALAAQALPAPVKVVGPAEMVEAEAEVVHEAPHSEKRKRA